MNKIKMTLRTKITLIFMIISTLMCIALSLSAVNSADKIIETIPLTAVVKIAEQPSSETYIEARSLTPAVKTVQARTTFRLSTFYTMLGIVIFGSAAIYVLMGIALKPLETLHHAVKNQKLDDLSQPIPLPPAQDEVYELTRSFNERNHRIFDSYTLQKNFSANVAHELCTPIAVIQTKLDVFRLKKDKAPTDYEALIVLIVQSSQRLSSIVESLLGIANSNEEDLSQEVEIYDILEETMYEFEDAMKEKGITCSLSGERLLIYGNDTLFKQAIYNLISNSVRYSTLNGSITLSLYKENGKICVSVADTGIGIPLESKEHLFEPFYRVDKSRSRELGGSGLGLALVKKIIDLHGGQITVLDNTPQGTIFTISLNE